MKSPIWKYFKKVSAIEAECSFCFGRFSSRGGSTSGLISYLLNRHDFKKDDIFSEITKIKEENPIKKFIHLKKCPTNFEITISKLVSSDNIYNIISKSPSIRQLLKTTLKKDPPSSHNTIIKIIQKTSIFYKERMKNTIQSLKNSNRKFVLYINEWSDLSLRKYLCLILSSNSDYLNISLYNIKGEFNTNNCSQMIIKNLENFSKQVY